jgi:hypothetical protein
MAKLMAKLNSQSPGQVPAMKGKGKGKRKEGPGAAVEGLNPGYMLFIQTCGLFWRDPANKALKLGLLTVLDNYQFLGICGNMWRFLSPAARAWWTLEAARPTLRKPELLVEVQGLAALTIKNLMK